MKLVYTGTNVEFPPPQMRKLEARLDRISKLLGRNGDRDLRVIVRQERHLQNVEITLNAWNNQLVSLGADADLFTAVCSSLDKLEKQVEKLRTKWRDTKRVAADEPEPEAPVEEKAPAKAKAAAAKAVAKPAARVFRVDHDGDDVPDQRHKPMTVDEAMLEIGAKEDYVMFVDAATNRLSVLLRRKDGNFDLIES